MSADYYYYVFGKTQQLTAYVVDVLYEKMPESSMAFYRNGEPRADRFSSPPEVFINAILNVAKSHLKFIDFYVGSIGEEWNDHKVVTISNGELVHLTDIGNNVKEIAQELMWYRTNT